MKTGLLVVCSLMASVIIFEILVVRHKPRFETAAGRESAAQREAPASSAAETSVVISPERAQPAPVEYALELELRGTLTHCAVPVAFIKDLTSGACRVYKIGGAIRGARIVRIEKGEVVFDAGGKFRRLGLAGGRSDASVSFVETIAPDTRVVKTGELIRERKEIFRELQKVRVKPQYENRKVNGLRIEGVTEGGVITSVGICNNDVIREVNNQKIDSYQKALQVFQKARTQQEIKVTLMREGELKNLSYRLQ